jgi:uncharacterized protein with FMN-binding domain
MRRAPFVIIGTVAGVAGVLSFHTTRAKLVVPTATGPTATTTPTTTPAAGSSTTTGGAGPSPSPTTTVAGGARTATGADVGYPYGDLAVSVTVKGSRISDVNLVTLNDGGSGRSSMIDNYAAPLLRNQVLAADSANIDGVAGATYTSQAYVDSVQSALDKLGFK